VLLIAPESVAFSPPLIASHLFTCSAKTQPFLSVRLSCDRQF